MYYEWLSIAWMVTALWLGFNGMSEKLLNGPSLNLYPKDRFHMLVPAISVRYCFYLYK